MDWYIATFIDNDELNRPGFNIAVRQYVIFALVLVVGIIIAFYISGRIAFSISRLAQYARNLPSQSFNVVQNKELESIKSNSTNQETKQLTNAFVFMESELGKNIRNLKQHQKNLKGLVNIRTQELIDANKDLKQEIKDRKQAEKKLANLIKELQKALDKVKTLSGLLPICSKCKKIRDDKGYWNNLEGYIENHSEALFTHSLCIECSDVLFGKENWYISKRERENKKK